MLKVNSERLWSSLMEMAKVSPTELGGNCRLALSPEDKAGRELFGSWCKQVGMTISVDKFGNYFARREGTKNLPPVVMGSHLDTQPKGGRFDGIYGVLAGLEVVRRLNDEQLVTEHPIEVAAWTEEEGARFAHAMLGSAVFIGAVDYESGLATKDAAGVTVQEALEQSGYIGDLPLRREFDSYFEAHIEQGPILERKGIPIGVVTGGQAITWLDVKVSGVPAHAGTTPMEMRKDALFGVSEMVLALEQLARDFAPKGLVTVGELNISKSSRNTIPGQVGFTLDLRHHSDEQIAAMEAEAGIRLQQIASSRSLNVQVSRHWHNPAQAFDADCIKLVQDAVDALDYPNMPIVSGAGHDAINLAKHCPTTMIFIPCVGGISHNEAEDALPEDVARGADVLLNAVLERANRG